MSDLSDNLQLFWTELSVHRAVVYARLEGVAPQAGWKLSGTIRGPRSSRHGTLPSTIKFADQGAGPSVLTKAIVPEPSYWSPDSPNLYDVTLQLERPGQPPLVEKRLLGFRPIRVGERYLLREGKPWVPRGVRTAQIRDFTFAAAREADLVVELWPTSGFDDSFFDEASREGVYLAVYVEGSAASIAANLQRYTRWPAVAMAIVVQLDDPAADLPKSGHNLILVQACDADAPTPRAWADVVAVAPGKTVGKPMFVGHKLSGPFTLAEARCACDALQRDLAPRQYAGYGVG